MAAEMKDKQWQVIFYPSWDASPEEYVFGDKDRELAFRQFDYFQEAKEDPEYSKTYQKIELRLRINQISRVVDEICFDS